MVITDHSLFVWPGIARAVEVSRQAINAIETGKFNPSLETAFRLGKLFGVAIEEIFELVH